MNTDKHTSGSTVKNHISLKKVFGTLQDGKLRTDRGSWFINKFFLTLAFFNIHDTVKLIIPSLPQARLPHHPCDHQLCQAKVWIDKNGETFAG